MSAGYQASLPGLARHGASDAEAVRALRRSVELALAARDRFWAAPENRAGRHRPLVAAGLGPYGAFLADGSEYTGDYDVGARGLAGFHRERLRILAGCGADLLACETVPSAVEARVLTDLLERVSGAQAWLSFSCRDGERISDGTPLAAVAADVAGSDRIVALGVNCTAPRWIGPLITALADATDKPIVVYPNSGERYDPGTRRWLPSDEVSDLADAAPRWVGLGARILGGCCRTGPEQIRALRHRLLDRPAGEKRPSDTDSQGPATPQST